MRSTLALLTALAALAVPAAAQAACPIGGNGVTENELGEPAKFSNLRPEGKMNCASARYVMNKWLRRSYAQSYRHSLPTRFFDGYVTWHCRKTSERGWRCREYTSSTSFRFNAYRF